MKNVYGNLRVVKELQSEKELLQKLYDYDCESFLAEYSSQLDAMKREIKAQIDGIESTITSIENTFDNIAALGTKYHYKD